MIFVFLAATPMGLVSSPAATRTDLTFDLLRIVHNIPSVQPENWQSIEVDDRRGSYVIFAERVPYFRISAKEIVSIMLEHARTRVLEGKDGKKESAKTSPHSKKQLKMDTLQDDSSFKAKFLFSKSEGKRLHDFANANEGERFDFRFGEKRLGVMRFVGSFGGGAEFTTFLNVGERACLWEIVAPIKEKLIWK
ncbi:MAG: hypothetical protein EXR70_22760 [Deltaproteobacteria bacterium]|nr:hypothetical protein [Deltaproteobacteria bacterium]